MFKNAINYKFSRWDHFSGNKTAQNCSSIYAFICIIFFKNTFFLKGRLDLFVVVSHIGLSDPRNITGFFKRKNN